MPRPAFAPARPHPVLLALLAALAACLLIAAAPSQAAAAQIAGVQLHPLWGGVSDADADRDFDLAKAGGAGMVRVDVGWSSIEQDGKGRYNAWYLDRVDAVVAKAEARGLKLLFTFMSSPCWASSAPADVKQDCAGSWWDRGVQHYPPSNPADYADALAFLVRRYGSRVAGWEVWNEPNQQAFFRTTDPVARYAELLRAAYPAAKAADPSALVVGGSLAMADADFTDRLYQAGVKGSFDAWSIHPYSEDRSPLTPAQAGYTAASFTSGVPAVRDVMLRNGDDKKLWLTEFGWNTSAVRGDKAWRNGISPQDQATFTTEAYARMRDWSYVDVGITFNLADTGGAYDPVGNFGLLYEDRTEKPAFAAFRDAAALVQAGAPGLGLSDDPAAAPGPAGAPAASAAGTQKAAAPSKGRSGSAAGTLRLRLVRDNGRWFARGRAPRGTTVRLKAFRLRGESYGRAAITRRVRVSRTGRFRARLRLRRHGLGRWRVSARTLGPAARIAVARTR